MPHHCFVKSSRNKSGSFGFLTTLSPSHRHSALHLHLLHWRFPELLQLALNPRISATYSDPAPSLKNQQNKENSVYLYPKIHLVFYLQLVLWEKSERILKCWILTVETRVGFMFFQTTTRCYCEDVTLPFSKNCHLLVLKQSQIRNRPSSLIIITIL